MKLMMMVTNFSETKNQGKSKCFRICVCVCVGGGGGGGDKGFWPEYLPLPPILTIFLSIVTFTVLLLAAKVLSFSFVMVSQNDSSSVSLLLTNLSYLTWLIAVESRKYWPFLFGTTSFVNILSTFSTRSNVTPCV